MLRESQHLFKSHKAEVNEGNTFFNPLTHICSQALAFKAFMANTVHTGCWWITDQQETQYSEGVAHI